jgi:hypothetical protein
MSRGGPQVAPQIHGARGSHVAFGTHAGAGLGYTVSQLKVNIASEVCLRRGLQPRMSANDRGICVCRVKIYFVQNLALE